MAIIAPNQQRSLDPFSDNRFSQVINRFSRLVSGGEDCILFMSSSFPLELIDYKTIRIGPGVCIKDDVLIHVTEDYDLDFDDENYFIDLSEHGVDAEGDYYIVMEYTYGRSLPSPKAYFKLIKNLATVYFPYTSRYIFIGKAEVVWNGTEMRFEIDRVYDYDDSRDVIRNQAKLYQDILVDGGEI